MALHHTEMVCETTECGYEVAVGNASRFAFERSVPECCPTCGHDLVAPGVPA